MFTFGPYESDLSEIGVILKELRAKIRGFIFALYTGNIIRYYISFKIVLKI